MPHEIIDKIIDEIIKLKPHNISLMEVCGTHTMAIARAGIRMLLPNGLKLLSGPGCPVCVTPQETIDYTIGLAKRKDIIITTFGDMVRVVGSETSLEHYDPRIVYSSLDALDIAIGNPDKDVVFVGVGFETTSPTVAATILKADSLGVKNFSIIPAFKLIPPALEFIAKSPKINVHGFILPGHVSTIIGARPYKFLSEKYHLPGCITGFEPLDILQSIKNLVLQIHKKEAHIDIEYTRVVRPEGNKKALEILGKVFMPCDAEWRGIGKIPESGFSFRDRYQRFDTTKKYPVEIEKRPQPRGCICGRVLLGLNAPHECRLFGKKCTPAFPIGPCMVSSEGSCAAYYKYGGYRKKDKRCSR